MTPEERLEFVNFLIFLRGKLQKLSLKLLLDGQDPTRIDESEARLAEAIRRLRVRIMQEWQADATEVMAEVRAVNDRAQRRFRELDSAADKIGKVAEIAQLIDEGLAAVLRLV